MPGKSEENRKNPGSQTRYHLTPKPVPIRDEGSVSYYAAIESASTPDTAAFAQRVWRETQRRLFTQAVRMAALGDGAPWIWSMIKELFPGIIQIVDRFHAKEHLSVLGKVLYSDQRASEWSSERHEELDKGKLRAVVATIRPYVAQYQEARRCLRYLWTNRKSKVSSSV